MWINTITNDKNRENNYPHNKELGEILTDTNNISIKRNTDLDACCTLWKYYYEINNENNNIWYVEINDNPEDNYITIGHISLYPEARGKGLWKKIYISLVNYFQKPIITWLHTYTADRVWKSLVEKWYAELQDQGFRFKDLERLVKEWKAHYKNGKVIID
jgi:GNAT superfamily N-acetyltransferase